jgi:hypothetical protein
LFQFLTELDESYEHMRAQILFSSELPTLEDAMARFQSEESRRELMSGAPPIQEKAEHTAMVSNQSELTTPATPQVEPVAMAVNGPNHRNKGKVKGSYTKVVKCDHCKKEGHDKGGCWFLHPELRLNWWVEFDEQSKKKLRRFTAQARKKEGEAASRSRGDSSDLSRDELKRIIRQLLKGSFNLGPVNKLGNTNLPDQPKYQNI